MGKLSEVMKEKGINCTELAQKSGVHRSIISTVANGKGSLSEKNWKLISAALGIPIEELICGTSDTPSLKFDNEFKWVMLEGLDSITPSQCGKYSYNVKSNWFINPAGTKVKDGYLLTYDEQVIVGTGIDYEQSMATMEDPLTIRALVSSDMIVHHEIRVEPQPICVDGELAIVLYCHSGNQLRLIKNTNFATLVIR